MAHLLAPEARTDLDELWHYAATTATIETADRLIDAITARFFLLATHPHLGRRRDDLRPGTRTFPVGEYLLLYRVEGDDVFIQRVVHGSRDVGNLSR